MRVVSTNQKRGNILIITKKQYLKLQKVQSENVVELGKEVNDVEYNAVAGYRSTNYISRHVKNSKVRLC